MAVSLWFSGGCRYALLEQLGDEQERVLAPVAPEVAAALDDISLVLQVACRHLFSPFA